MNKAIRQVVIKSSLYHYNRLTSRLSSQLQSSTHNLFSEQFAKSMDTECFIFRICLLTAQYTTRRLIPTAGVLESNILTFPRAPYDASSFQMVRDTS